MLMKLNKTGQLLLVSGVSLLVAGVLTACGATNTVDFVYVTSSQAAGTNNYGEVNVFEINKESGFMRQIPTSPFPSGGRNPVSAAVSSDNANLYVLNEDDNTIVQFIIGSDGKLYPEDTVNTPGILPVTIAVSGSNLFVLDTYQPLNTCSTTSPCAGSIAVYPISAAAGSVAGGTLGSPLTNGSRNYWPLNLPGSPADVIAPSGIAVLPSKTALYVSAYDATKNVGYVFGFSIGTDGTLTALNGGVPVAAGVKPTAIASDSTGGYVYVTDGTANVVLAYAVGSTTLTPLTSGTGGGNSFPTGDNPSAILADPGSSYVYVTNKLDATITAYSASSGALTRVGSYATGLQPVALGVEPALHKYLYTVNFLGNSVSDFETSATDGSLINAQSSPYKSNPLPTAVAAIPHNQPTAQ